MNKFSKINLFDLRQGDIVLIQNDTFLSKLIMKFMDEPQDPARVSHVGVIVIPNRNQELYLRRLGKKVYDMMLLEVNWRVLVRRMTPFIYPKMWIARHKYLDKRDLDHLVSTGLCFLDIPYSIRRLLYHALYLTFNITLLSKRLPLTDLDCSTLVSLCYTSVGVLFDNKIPRLTTPDDIWDCVVTDSNWDVFELERD